MRLKFRSLAIAAACSLIASVPYAQTKPAAPAAKAATQPAAAKATADKAAAPDKAPATDKAVATDKVKADVPGSQPTAGNPVVLMKTSMGEIRIELFKDKAPLSAENFATYVNDGFFDGTIFHRVIPNFMIQGGGFTADMQQKTTRSAIKNEATNGLKNLRGTLSMARLPDPDTGTSQFFLNVVDNASLDQKDQTPRGFGYAVFGKVIAGMDVVDLIKAVPTTNHGQHQNVPVTPVVIESAKMVKE